MVPVKALVYSRVSTDAQERDGTSLDTQERACVEYAESQGMLVVERIRDTASGFTLDRPGMELVRQLLRQGAVDVVISRDPGAVRGRDVGAPRHRDAEEGK